jgi:phosphoribosyl 1,2-cyclic phosphodiesterase
MIDRTRNTDSMAKPDLSMKIIVLNSGSNGNAIYVESARSGTAVLLDCGISRRQIDMRLKIHGRAIDRIRGIFITHEHADHLRGLQSVLRVHRIPVYLTEQTYLNVWKKDVIKWRRFIRTTETMTVDDIVVQAFPKSHDAADPVMLLVSSGEKRFLYATDLGTTNPHLESILPTLDALLLESNYDKRMLWNGEYPEYLKERIDADHGHLSNTQAMEILERHASGKLRLLILGHLSENNNAPEVVESELRSLLEKNPAFAPTIHIASRYNVSEVFPI